MASSTLCENSERVMVGMGQIAVSRNPCEMSSVLGSCVGVAIYHPRLHVGGLAHVVLPKASEPPAHPGKFADTAVPEILQQLDRFGANRSGLLAKIAGGACMFGTQGPLQIGLNNVDAVLHALNLSGIRLIGQDVGGSKGRKITFKTTTGELIIEIVGQKPYVL